MNISVYTLIANHTRNFPNSHYFDRETLRFFGERIGEMRVLKRTCIVTDYSGDEHECYILSKLQHNNPSGAKRHYSYFDINTYEEVQRAC